MKLTKLFNQFQQNHLTHDAFAEVRQAHDFALLRQFLPVIFPTGVEAIHSTNMLHLDRALKHHDNPFTLEYLPYHTRDNDWLAGYTAKVVNEQTTLQKYNEMLHEHHDVHKDTFNLVMNSVDHVDLKNVKAFVRHAPEFDAHRNAYEQNLVKGQINYMATYHVPNAIMDERYAAYNINESPNYDRLFRAGVVDSMSNLGIDYHNIEIGLESDSAWRKYAMEKAFNNEFPTLALPDARVSTLIPYYHMRRQHKDAWLRLREYLYYQEHSSIIDELGKATKIMKISPEKAQLLAQRNFQYQVEYQSIGQEIRTLSADNQDDNLIEL